MASSNIARFLRKQYLDSLASEDNLHSSDPLFGCFKTIGGMLKANSTALTNAESISLLHNLNDALAEWQILEKQKKFIKRIFSYQDVAQVNRSRILAKLSDVKEELRRSERSSSQTINLPRLDRYTFYTPDQITGIKDLVSLQLNGQMVDWLLRSDDDFKAVGICGMFGSGRTELVKSLLKQEHVAHKFKRIIWACLSNLTCEEENDVWIMQYLLYRLGLDTDSLLGNVHENRDWLMEELERRLLMNSSGNYILVLDDMWHCSEWFADHFLRKLREKGGGAVIVTSQRKTVAEKLVDNNKLIHLDSWPLFIREAIREWHRHR